MWNESCDQNDFGTIADNGSESIWIDSTDAPLQTKQKEITKLAETC